MNILITAGPTWVKIDEVRILTSIFTGKTGLYLAQKFKENKHLVTLLINNHCINTIYKGIKLIPFRYFDELKEAISKQLKKIKYDVIIHSAAVSDYKLKKTFKGKIPSGKEELILKFTPTEKLIKLIRKLAPETVLVQFKLEVTKKCLIEKAYKSLKENKSDFVVANALEDLKMGYKAFIIDKSKKVITINSKKNLFYALLKIIELSKNSNFTKIKNVLK
ncbi:MAG: phosphopantothenoylcysteine decarboxylase [Candidatus Omnitrophica bacterium]|nr:phosphopantothenoylcysteine decarboxylase [Candidatus Omnitrophota bacterium]